MSDVLASWCNAIPLSRPVETLESSFANGFLFGDLLRRYNQQHDFPTFRDSRHTEDVVKNFDSLQTTFVRMGIKVSARHVEEIARCVPGAAARLLYELKSKLTMFERVEVGRPKPGQYKTIANLQVSLM